MEEKDFSHLTDLTYCWQPIFFVVSLRADAVGKVCSCKGTAVTKTNIFHLSFCKILPYSRRRGLFLTFTTHDIRPWSSRISYFENNRQNLSSHQELVISENAKNFGCYMSKWQAKNWLFSEITSSRYQEENNRLLFSVTHWA